MLLSAGVAQAGELKISLEQIPVFTDTVYTRCNAQWAGSGFMMDKTQFMQQCKIREFASLMSNLKLITASDLQQYKMQQGSPVSAGSSRVVIKNCTGQTEYHRRSLKIELADAVTATTTNEVKVTYGNSVSASVTGPDELLSASVNKDLSVAVNLSKTQATKGEYKRSETVDINEPVPAYTALIIRYQNTRADTQLSFNGIYRLQAGAVTDTSRSYQLTGTAVYSNTFLASDTELFEEALPQDPLACQNHQISGV